MASRPPSEAGGDAARRGAHATSADDVSDPPIVPQLFWCLTTFKKIHHIAFDQKSQVPGITLAGCGNTAKNNEIYNTPHFAVKMKFANDCVAEKNYMHDLPEYHHFDGGALYLATGGQFFNRGNVVKQNYFENIIQNFNIYLD